MGSDDGRIALYLAEHEAVLTRPPVPVEGPLAASIREVLGRRGAVFFADVAREVGRFPNDVLEALWQMVWAGEVTNDTLEPLRSRARPDSAGSARRAHPRHPRAPRTGPAGSEGRWSLRSLRWPSSPSQTDRSMALCRALLDRYGVVTRESTRAEDIAGGFSSVYGMLKALEDQGRVRRGHFIEGRGGAQFALPGADERLRARRDSADDADGIVFAGIGPRQRMGLCSTPGLRRAYARFPSAAGAVAVPKDGALLGWLGRGEHPLLTFLPDEEPARSRAARTLAQTLAKYADVGARRALLIASVDGREPNDTPLLRFFVDAGFTPSSRGLQKRRSPVEEEDDGDARMSNDG